MSLPLFVLSTHCTSKVHCGTCRSKMGGSKWRASLKEIFELPNNDIDFECPYGMQWTEPQVLSHKPKMSALQQQRESGSRGGGCGCSKSGAK
jgi:hypothetical protein